jgi:hypothetical protein
MIQLKIEIMENVIENKSRWERIMEISEFNRYSVIAVALLIVGCLGGIAVGMGAVKHVFTLILVVVPTMATLSFLLAIAPMKWIYAAGLTSIIIDILLMLYFGLV